MSGSDTLERCHWVTLYTSVRTQVSDIYIGMVSLPCTGSLYTQNASIKVRQCHCHKQGTGVSERNLRVNPYKCKTRSKLMQEGQLLYKGGSTHVRSVKHEGQSIQVQNWLSVSWSVHTNAHQNHLDLIIIGSKISLNKNVQIKYTR